MTTDSVLHLYRLICGFSADAGNWGEKEEVLA